MFSTPHARDGLSRVPPHGGTTLALDRAARVCHASDLIAALPHDAAHQTEGAAAAEKPGERRPRRPAVPKGGDQPTPPRAGAGGPGPGGTTTEQSPRTRGSRTGDSAKRRGPRAAGAHKGRRTEQRGRTTRTRARGRRGPKGPYRGPPWPIKSGPPHRGPAAPLPQRVWATTLAHAGKERGAERGQRPTGRGPASPPDEPATPPQRMPQPR